MDNATSSEVYSSRQNKSEIKDVQEIMKDKNIKPIANMVPGMSKPGSGKVSTVYFKGRAITVKKLMKGRGGGDIVSCGFE